MVVSNWVNLLLKGVFFMYEISPIKVTLAETQKTFAEFLTGVCAIVGGIFTVCVPYPVSAFPTLLVLFLLC